MFPSGKPISSWERPAPDPAAEIPAVKIALTLERQRLAEALDRRVEAMYRLGLVDETRTMLAKHPPGARPFGSIGYAEAAAVVSGEMALDAAMAETRRRTRAYAKRQMTWLRSEPNVHWIDATEKEKAFQAALRLIRG